MKNTILLITLLLLLISPFAAPAKAAKNPLIKATVVDVADKPVKGAYIFFYDSSDTRRAVDLVSPVTDKSGYCEKEIPPGKYWVLARLKSNASFDMGPLLIEDKFSGDPIEIDAAIGAEIVLDFKVVDLLDTIKTKSKKRKDLNTVSGKVVNERGEGRGGVFAYANRNQSPLSMPDYFSAWTASDGAYTIYLPKGKYSLGASSSFTRDRRYKAVQEIAVDGDLSDIDIILDDSKKLKMKN